MVHVDGNRAGGFSCDIACGRVSLSIHEREREREPRDALRWQAIILCLPSGRIISCDGDGPYVTFWRAANAYAGAADHDGLPNVDWDEVATALEDVGVRFV